MPQTSKQIRLLSKISSMYYKQDLNQQQIADRLQISRPKVSRLLKKARQEGIVQITVVTPNENFVELEQALEETYDLQEVVLVDQEETGELTKQQIGAAAAQYLHRTISPGHCIGVTWGTTLQAMVEAMQQKATNDIEIVQALGGVGPAEAKAHAADISRSLAQLLEGKLTLLPAPGIVGSVEAKNVLMNDRQVNNALEKITTIDTLYVGIGALQTNPVLTENRQEISEEACREVMESGAVGDIALRFFDQQGHQPDITLNDLVIGITLEQIRAVDTVVGMAGGPQKMGAIQGALNGKYIDVLVTDQQTANDLLH